MTVDYPNNKIVGETLLFNVYLDENNKYLTDKVFLLSLLTTITQRLELIPLIDTFTYKYFKEEHPVGEGSTGLMILTTSHIAFHTWKEQGYMRLELSICKKDINWADVKLVIHQLFSFKCIKFVTHEVREW